MTQRILSATGLTLAWVGLIMLAASALISLPFIDNIWPALAAPVVSDH